MNATVKILSKVSGIICVVTLLMGLTGLLAAVPVRAERVDHGMASVMSLAGDQPRLTVLRAEASKDVAAPGDEVLLHLEIVASPAAALDDVRIICQVPDGVWLIRSTSTRGERINLRDNQLEAIIGRLEPGDTVELQVVVQVLEDVVGGTSLVSHFEVLAADEVLHQAIISFDVAVAEKGALPQTGSGLFALLMGVVLGTGLLLLRWFRLCASSKHAAKPRYL